MEPSDLHLHSTFSDGDLSPAQVVLEAKKLGLHTISITDHNSISAYKGSRKDQPDLFSFAEKRGIHVVPGVELTVMFKGFELHLLGYYFDPSNETLNKRLERYSRDVQEYSQKECAHLAKLGFNIGYKELARISLVVDRDTIARRLLAPDNQRRLEKLNLNRTNPEDDLIFNYLSNPKSKLSTPYPYFTASEAINLITRAGGVSVLAHPPESMPNLPWGKRKRAIVEVLRSLKKIDLQGVETKYSSYTSEQELFMEHTAKRLKLVKTGGSDFHGPSVPRFKMGEFSKARESYVARLRQVARERKKPPLKKRNLK